jgi:hypothetical protein
MDRLEHSCESYKGSKDSAMVQRDLVSACRPFRHCLAFLSFQDLHMGKSHFHVCGQYRSGFKGLFISQLLSLWQSKESIEDGNH